MSRIKSYLLGFITFCTPLVIFGQDQINAPQACVTPPAGILLGGDFNSQAIVCLDYNTDESKVVLNGARLNATTNFDGDVYYNFNYRDSDGPLTFPTTPIDQNIYKVPGTYWIVMKGKKGSADYIKCRKIEVFATPMMKINYDNCTTGKVTVNILKDADNEIYDGYKIMWGDGNIEEKAFSSIPASGISVEHTYTTVPTTMPIIQGVYFSGTFAICPGEAVLFNISTPVSPKISELEGLNGGNDNKIIIKAGNTGTEYDIQVKTTGGTWTSTGKTIKAPATNATATETVGGFNGTNEYCFRLKKLGSCATEILSNEVCTIKTTNQILSPVAVKVDWTTTQPDISRYQVIYKESPTGLNQNSAYTQPTVKTYTFDQMDCSKKYEFRVVGTVGVGTDKVDIKSPTFIVDPVSGGKLPNELAGFASVDNNAVRVTIVTSSPKNKYNIYRAEGKSTNFQALTSIGLPSYVDNNVEQDKQQYCYKVEYEDACGNLSDQSEPFCTIFLNSKQANTINWTPFSLVSTPNLIQNIQPTQYVIEILDENGASLGNWGNTVRTEEDVRDALDRYLDDPSMNGKVAFRILATQAVDYVLTTGPVTLPFYSYSNIYTFMSPARVYLPSAFTPNADAINDIFKATGKFISEFNMVIYNRWGVPIFESVNMDIGWDGTENGSPAQPGNYSYKIFGTDTAGQKFNRLGSVLLLK